MRLKHFLPRNRLCVRLVEQRVLVTTREDQYVTGCEFNDLAVETQTASPVRENQIWPVATPERHVMISLLGPQSGQVFF